MTTVDQQNQLSRGKVYLEQKGWTHVPVKRKALVELKKSNMGRVRFIHEDGQYYFRRFIDGGAFGTMWRTELSSDSMDAVLADIEAKFGNIL